MYSHKALILTGCFTPVALCQTNNFSEIFLDLYMRWDVVFPPDVGNHGSPQLPISLMLILTCLCCIHSAIELLKVVKQLVVSLCLLPSMHLFSVKHSKIFLVQLCHVYLIRISFVFCNS